MVATILEYLYTAITVFLLWYFLKRSTAYKNSLRENLKNWALFGFIFNLYSLSWIYTVYPLTWMKEGFPQLLAIGLLHILFSLSTVLCFPLVALSFSKKIKPLLLPFFFALSLTAAEILRSFLFSALYYGKGSTIDLHWTMSALGEALSTTPLIEFAYFGGVYTLTFILGYLVYICHSKKHFQEYKSHLLIILLLLAAIHYMIPVQENNLTIGAITTNFPSLQKTSPKDISLYFENQAKTADSMTKELSSFSPDIIVYPEDTRYVLHVTKEMKKKLVTNFSKTLFIDGDTLHRDNWFSNYSLFYIPESEKSFSIGKRFLTPFNEYVPSIFGSIFKLFIKNNDFENYENNHTFTPSNTAKVFPTKKGNFGIIICSEIFSQATISLLKKEHATVIFYQAQLSVFHNNPLFIAQIRSVSKVAAAQLRAPLIGSVNGAPSFFVSPYGKMVHVTETGFTSNIYSLSKNKTSVLK